MWRSSTLVQLRTLVSAQPLLDPVHAKLEPLLSGDTRFTRFSPSDEGRFTQLVSLYHSVEVLPALVTLVTTAMYSSDCYLYAHTTVHVTASARSAALLY